MLDLIKMEASDVLAPCEANPPSPRRDRVTTTDAVADTDGDDVNACRRTRAAKGLARLNEGHGRLARHDHTSHRRAGGAGASALYAAWFGPDSDSQASVHVWALQMLQRAMYAEFLEPYLETFSPTQLLVLSSEDLFDDSVRTMERVAAFLELPPIDWAPIVATVYTVRSHDRLSEARADLHRPLYVHAMFPACARCQAVVDTDLGRHGPCDLLGAVGARLDPHVREWLQQFYRVPNQKLATLLTRYRLPLPAWLHTEV